MAFLFYFRAEHLGRKILRARSHILMVFLTFSLITFGESGLSAAAPVVTFYDDQASFLAAISAHTTLDFEGITTDTGNHNFGPAYHTGAVTFTSPFNPTFGFDMVVAGKYSQTEGVPFDSAILIPDVEPSSIVATFDAGSNVTAVGGFFLNCSLPLEDTHPGGLALIGSSGPLDLRSVLMGTATSGKPKTFFGYTVVGDTIVSISVRDGYTAPAIDDFTYGSVPEPSSCLLLTGILGLVLAATRRRPSLR